MMPCLTLTGKLGWTLTLTKKALAGSRNMALTAGAVAARTPPHHWRRHLMG